MMKRKVFPILSCLLLLGSTTLYAQTIKLDENRLQAVDVSLSIERMNGKAVVKAVKDSSVKAVDEPTFVKVKGIDFQNGTIEVKVLS